MSRLIDKQREFFNTGVTREYEFRIHQLNRLRQVIKDNEKAILKAVYHDLGKHEFETYASELMTIYNELHYMITHLRKLMKPTKTTFPLIRPIINSQIEYEPLGSVLIISPWNYPVSLAITPIIGAIAAGNTIVLKPSEISGHVTQVLVKMISENFNDKYIAVVEGEAEETQELLDQGFDHVFFTGSTQVGREVMKTAAKHLTPVTLELGGKSPAIIAEDADLEKAARRIAWGKTLNGGQTCIAPDYVYVHRSVKQKFVRLLQEAQIDTFGPDMLNSEYYTHMISEDHFNHMKELMEGQTILHGGQTDKESLRVALTLIDEPDPDSPIMQEEIFGPLLPIISYDHITEVKRFVESRPKPLALYLFTESNSLKEYVKSYFSFGGGTINHTLVHYIDNTLPFGGVGHSGIGGYHGKHSFDTFSNEKPVVDVTTIADPSLLYAPYSDWKVDLIKTYLKWFT